MKVRCRYRCDSSAYVEADLGYQLCEDGYRVTGGSLPATGFAMGRGITLPEELDDGVKVTECDMAWDGGDLDFVDGPSLKRISIDLTAGSSDSGCVGFGGVYGPVERLRVTSALPVRLRGLSSQTLVSLVVAAPTITFEREVRCPALEIAYLYGEVEDGRRGSGALRVPLFADCVKLGGVAGQLGSSLRMLTGEGHGAHPRTV